MEIIKFTISARFGKFTKPDTNKILLTYQIPPKPTILGIIGSIIGFNGYNDRNKKYEYVEKLKNLDIGIILNGGIKPTFFDKFVNSVGVNITDKKKKDGCNWIVEEELIDNPSFEIYLKNNGLDSDVWDKIKEYLLNSYSEYPIYFGKNNCLATIENCSIVEGDLKKEYTFLDSVFIIDDKDCSNYKILYTEILPTEIDSFSGYMNWKKIGFGDLRKEFNYSSVDEKKISFI